MFLKQIIIPFDIHNFLFFVTINKTKFIVLEFNNHEKIYIRIPHNVLIEKKNNILILISKEEHILALISRKIRDTFKYKNKVYCIRLSLKGLGFKITKTIEKDNTFLVFKVGFSNLIKIKEPTAKVSTNIRKNKLYLLSSDLNYLGNFAKLIRNIKTPNPYNGKGIFFKNQLFKKKVFKKK